MGKRCCRLREPRLVFSLITALSLFLVSCATPTTPAPATAAQPTPTSQAAATTPSGTSVPALSTNPAPTVPPAEGRATSVAGEAAAEPTQGTAQFQPDALTLSLAPVVEDLQAPVFVTHAGDNSGRLFIVEKAGVVLIRDENGLLPQPFLDIRDRVGSRGSEQGLLGLAFPPGYAELGYFFVNYTDSLGDTVISRFQVTSNPDQADPASEVMVLQLDQPAANHNGGMLAFGPDGYLYIGTGDGGGGGDRFGNGQNPSTLLGKMLRIDVTGDPSQPYRIPEDNPWVAQDWDGADVRDEVWAVGLRNPWRYSFDRESGDFWIADVGQNVYEEVNHISWQSDADGGLNFGWPIMEGAHCFPETARCNQEGLVIPVADYSHAEGHCSVTGGYVYRGEQFPLLQGVYFYGDYCSGSIWAMWPDRTGGRQNQLVLRSNARISSFGEDEKGELYLTDLATGVVYQVAAHPR